MRTVLDGAHAASREGKFAQAIAAYEHLVAANPSSLEAWTGLSECLLAARSAERALLAWERALQLRPDLADLHCGRARVLQHLGRAEAARGAYERALALDAGHSGARFGLAKLAFDAGRIDAAAELLNTVDAREPGRSDVRWLSARIAMARSDFGRAHTLLSGLLANPALDREQRAEAVLMLSDALAELDRPAEAFRAASRGKALLRAQYAGRAAGREAEAAKLHRLAAWFAAANAADWAGAPPSRAAKGGPATHMFLMGFPRSGTTLLEQMLAGHPDASALEEAPTLAEHYAEFLADDAGCARLARLSAAEADHWRARYWAAVAASGGNTSQRVFVDKAPAGTLSMPLVAKLFPDARILFALRDPRDVVLSCFRTNFQMNAMTYAFTSLEDTAACYDACMAMAQTYRRVLPLHVLDVRHEALVGDLATTIARVGAFIGLEPHAAMTDVAATAARRVVRTPSARQVRVGVNRRGLDRWRAYAAELAPVIPVLQPWIEAFGYPPA